MQRLMRHTRIHWSCRPVQEEKIFLGPVVSALDHTMDQAWAVHTQVTSRTFHQSFLSHHFAWWDTGYGSKHCKVLSTCLKTYRPTTKEPLSFKWNTTFQRLSILPLRKTAISSLSSTTLLHRASATAKHPYHFSQMSGIFCGPG